MNVRAISSSNDINKLRSIHENFYSSESLFSDFDNLLTGIIVEDDDGTVICGGGVKQIAESVIITNKSLSPRVRRLALLQMLQAQLFVVEKHGMSQLHAFIQDEKWLNQLLRYGFRPTIGKSLVIG